LSAAVDFVSVFGFIKVSSPPTRSVSEAKLVYRKVKRKRSKGLVMMLLPALIFIGAMGWMMYTLGAPQKTQPQRKAPRKDNVTLLPIGFEKQQKIKNVKNAIRNS
jgi:hypothetical protein